MQGTPAGEGRTTRGLWSGGSVRGAGVWLAAATLLAGCGGVEQGGEGAKSPGLPVLTRVTTAAQASASPFSLIFESSAELFDRRDAYERLMDRCTTRYGFPFVPGDRYRPPTQFFDLAQPYGPVDLATVTRLGYHDPESLATGSPPEPFWEGSATPSRVVFGTGEQVTTPPGAGDLPRGGCDAEVTKTLGGLRPAATVKRAGSVFVGADKDPRWRAAVASWASCMKRRGYDYPSSVAAVDEFRTAPGGPSERELATARADVECKNSTRQVDVLVAVLAAHEALAIAENSKEFDDYRRWRADSRTRVDAVLDATAPPARRYWVGPAGKHSVTPVTSPGGDQ